MSYRAVLHHEMETHSSLLTGDSVEFLILEGLTNLLISSDLPDFAILVAMVSNNGR
jgi:hypothetical protein